MGTAGTQDHHAPADVFDLLEQEDREISKLFGRVESTEGPSVTERYEHGNYEKDLIGHLTVREAAKDELVRGLAAFPDLRTVRDRLAEHDEARKQAIDTVDKMARGIQGIDLNQGQDFDGAMSAVRALVVPEIEWELGEGLPTLRGAIAPETRTTAFHESRYLRHHAHTPGEAQHWYERIPGMSLLETVRDRLREYPKAGREERE